MATKTDSTMKTLPPGTFSFSSAGVTLDSDATPSIGDCANYNAMYSPTSSRNHTRHVMLLLGGVCFLCWERYLSEKLREWQQQTAAEIAERNLPFEESSQND